MESKQKNAVEDFKNMIYESWSYDRFTKTEKENFERVLNFVQQNDRLKGSYKQKFNQLHNIYTSFLYALDYSPMGWRD